jgi:hypothetical protein
MFDVAIEVIEEHDVRPNALVAGMAGSWEFTSS